MIVKATHNSDLNFYINVLMTSVIKYTEIYFIKYLF